MRSGTAFLGLHLASSSAFISPQNKGSCVTGLDRGSVEKIDRQAPSPHARLLGQLYNNMHACCEGPLHEISPGSQSITFADIVGYENAKLELKPIVDYLQNPELMFRTSRGNLTAGIVLAGSSDVEKELMARAVAEEAGVSFYSPFSNPLFNAAPTVSKAIAQLEPYFPCVIFIGDIEAFSSDRAEFYAALDLFLQHTGNIVIGAATEEAQATALPPLLKRTIRIGVPAINGQTALNTAFDTGLLN